MNAGPLDRRIAFERATLTRDAFNAQVSAWAPYAQVWSKVTFGTGQERRVAAQEGGSAAATFRTRWNPILAGVTIRDRIQFLDAAWNITSIVPFGRNEGLDFTAVRAV